MVSTSKKLSVIIPVYNEEGTVTALLDKVVQAVISTSLEIIIVNDGSTDGSPALIEKWVQEHRKSRAEILYLTKKNGGKGSAVKTGIKASTGLLLTFWINLLYHSNLTDEPTCYKTFDGPLIRSMLIEGDKFEWEPEITAKLLRMGFEIREVPVSYNPRKINEGKKIKWHDGIQGLWTAFRWRFARLGTIRREVSASSGELAAAIRSKKRMTALLFSVFVLAFVIRLLFALPGLSNPDLQMRPESDSFLASAKQILKHGTFRARYPSSIAIFPSGTPAYKIASLDQVRAPLYPAWLAGLFAVSGGSLVFCIVMGCLLGAAIIFPVYFSGRLFGSDYAGLIAGLLFALNPTAIALSPMFLPDTLFALIVAFQGYFFLRFIKSAFGMNLVCAILLAGIAALIRPANALWILPCIIVILFFHKLRASLKFNYIVISMLLFAAVIFPWILGNHLAGIGWRIDTISSEVLLKNVSALEADLDGKSDPAPYIRKHRLEERRFYGTAPEKYAQPAPQLAHRDEKMRRILLEHPFRYLKLHFGTDSLRRVTAPDFNALFGNLGFWKSGKIQPDSFQTQLITTTMFTVTALLYMCCALGLGWFLLTSLDRRHFLYLLLWFLLAGYYIFMPGPIAIPRYLLPALPFLCTASAYGLLQFWRIIRKKSLLCGLDL